MTRVASHKTTGSTMLLWMRADLPRKDCMAYWRGPHSQLMARIAGFLDYRQHHFPADPTGLWPAIDGVETAIPADRRIDGTPEVTFEGPLSSLRAARNKAVYADEKNVFDRTLLYATAPLNGRRFTTATIGRVDARAVILLRRRDGVARSRAAAVVHDRIGSTLASLPGITEVRTQAFLPFHKHMWNTPGVAHDNPARAQFHAAVVLGATDHDALHNALNGTAVRALADTLRQTFNAIHAYPVAATYIYRQDGRPTLPQTGPMAKPRMDPVKRTVPSGPTPKLPGNDLPPGRLIPLPGGAPEDVIADQQGRLLAGITGGAIVRYNPATQATSVVAVTGGRPLGLELDPEGRLLVCDAHRGLLRVAPDTGDVETLVQYVDDVPLRFCSNAAALPDGSIWFTESTNRYDFEHYIGALIEHRASGRLLRRDPDGTVETVLSGLHFANGIAVTPDQSALLYAETADFSVSRLQLTGPNQGKREAMVENLPGFPDNLSAFGQGRSWLALTNPRNRALDRLARTPALVRKAIWRLPDRLQPPPATTTWAIALTPDGDIVDEVHGDRPDFHTATGAAELNGRLYLAGTHFPALLELDLSCREEMSSTGRQ